ncbi:MAG: monofunctional biosynthetic peptidoglycan transglycosylase [Spirochaetes bacterium]|nr:MAG: monofunctional biosynthetic peptidoglycan transglycosylase [Spirochaetota bacterium]
MGLIFRIIKFALLAVAGVHVLFFLAILGLSLVFSRINPPSSTLMLYRHHIDKHEIREVLYQPLDKIKPWIPHLTIACEDAGFYQHRGIDVNALKRAYAMNKGLGGNFLGGSTITQQLARTLFLTPQKSYFRKYAEIIAALTMELAMPKKRILELYLNYVELGRGVFGLGQAARTHYGKPLDNLSQDEAVRLITILPSPVKYSPKTFHSSGILEDRYRSLREKIRSD